MNLEHFSMGSSIANERQFPSCRQSGGFAQPMGWGGADTIHQFDRAHNVICQLADEAQVLFLDVILAR